jgi:hypothetical protein
MVTLFEKAEKALQSHSESSRHASGAEWAKAICNVLEEELKELKRVSTMLNKRTTGLIKFGVKKYELHK